MEQERTQKVQSFGQMAQSLKGSSSITENYSHIELTEEEENEVLRMARREKHFKQVRLQYQDKISKQPEYTKMTTKALYSYALTRAVNMAPAFGLDRYNDEIFNLLCMYFSGNPEFEKDGLRLDKGIMLLGPIGCGKTTMMKAFSINSHNAFSVVSCRKVGDDFSQAGADSIITYSSAKPVYAHEYFGQTSIGQCFDDLGTESIKKHFGNELNVMTDIILNRYDNHHLKGKTHFTGNLTADMIEEMYGVRVKSRLREMCNMIVFDPKSADRRR